MSQLSDFTESKLRQRFGNKYVEDSLSTSDTGTIKRISYEIKEDKGKKAYGWNGRVAYYTHWENTNKIQYFDIDSGDYLSDNVNEAARKVITKGKEKFNNFDFNKAREYFHSAYLISTSQSNEEREAKTLRDLTDKVITAINAFNNGNYKESRDQLYSAYSEATDQMRATIGSKRNEFSETLNGSALNKFEQEDWSKAQELFNEAYHICVSDYTNEREFKNRRDIAEKMEGINSSNKLAMLKEALNSTQNQRMRNILSNKMNKLEQYQKENQERIELEKGVNEFINKNFITAKNILQNVYNISTIGSSNKVTSKSYLNITNMVLESIDLMNSGEYLLGREKLNNAYNNTSENRMKSAINQKKNEIAEIYNNSALSNFEQGNWTKAEELFNEAYLICTVSYINEQEFKNRKNIAEKLKSINSNNEITLLTEALNSIQNQRMRQIISMKLSKANKVTAEKNFNEAKSMWNQAWIAESAGRSNEASEKFSKAKELFEKASQLDSQNSTYRNWSTACSLKITGNNEFNQGVQLQMEGEELRNKSKFQEAKVKYQLAEKKFEEGLRKSGDQRFQSTINIARDQIKDIEALIQSQSGINTNPNQGKTIEDDNKKIDVDQTIEHN